MENAFKWRHFEPEMILLCVRWYLRYALSYRDLEEMMAERGFGGGSHHHFSLGTALCARNRPTQPPTLETNQ